MSEEKDESIDNETISNDQPPCEGVPSKDESPEWVDLLGSGSILKKILKEGQENTRPQRHHFCTLTYKLALDEEFTKVIESQDNFEIQLCDCEVMKLLQLPSIILCKSNTFEVVQGLDVAIGLMNVGEECLLKIEPRLAFGELGLKPDIPGNTTVFYQVSLISTVPDEDLENVSLSDRKSRGNRKRERGNWWYGRGENALAIQCYRRALDFLDEVEGGITNPAESEESTDSNLQSLLEDRLSVYNNMAAAQIKLELYEAALNSLQTVLRCQPNNTKALFRKAKIYKAKNELNSALKCLKKADEVAPNDNDVQKELNTITKLLQKQKSSERELAKRMFADQTTQKGDGRPEHSKSNINILAWAATLAASLAVGLVGIAAYKFKFA